MKCLKYLLRMVFNSKEIKVKEENKRLQQKLKELKQIEKKQVGKKKTI